MEEFAAPDLGYSFKSEELLKTALTHSSAGEPHNERLEFLGDAVLELIATEYLYTSFKELSEGVMTSTRASAVCEPSLCTFAESLKLGDFLILGKGEESSGGRSKPSILADAMEAVLGAIYLDGGYASARDFIMRSLGDIIPTAVEEVNFTNFKSNLQKVVQQRKRKLPAYKILGSHGPEHSRIFEVAVYVDGKELGRGNGNSKKAAEQEAAKHALATLAVTEG